MRGLQLILGDLLAATNVPEVDAIVRELVEDHAATWRPVGDRETNFATIHISTDPANAIIERITNAIDAMLEKGHAEHINDDFRTPRAAGERWYGVPRDGGLSRITDDERQRLADQILITVRDGESASRPTVDVRDYGCGIEPSKFPTTILSLNANNKLSRFYTCGIYGQGGSTTLSFARRVVMVSRAFARDSEVGFAIVQFNDKDATLFKEGSYEYLVPDLTSGVFSVPVGDLQDAFDPGTLVRHVGYDFQKYAGPISPNLNNLYGIAHYILFDPILPFWVEDKRTGADPNTARRSVIGSRHRLLRRGSGAEADAEGHSDVLHEDAGYHDFGQFGGVNIEYWILDPRRQLRDVRPIRYFVQPVRPVVLTFNGQLQASLTATLIRKEAELPSMNGRLVVHVNCERLSPEGRRELFSSTREVARQTALVDMIHQTVVELLKNDPDLRRLEEEALESQRRNVDEQAERELRAEVARILGEIMGGVDVAVGVGASTGAAGRDTRPRPSPGRRPRYKAPPIPPSFPPTFVRIAGERFRIWPGRVLAVPVECDAADGQDDALELVMPPSSLVQQGRTPLRGGRMRFYIRLADETGAGAVGTTHKITVELRPKAAKTLSASAEVNVTEPPEPDRKAKIHLPDFDPIEINPGHPKWEELDWNEHEDVAQVETSGGKHLIYWSGSFFGLLSSQNRLARRAPALGASLRARYRAWVCAHSLWQYQADEKDLDEENTELASVLKRERHRAASLIVRLLENEIRQHFEAGRADIGADEE
jgi:hypothetical protein